MCATLLYLVMLYIELSEYPFLAEDSCFVKVSETQCSEFIDTFFGDLKTLSFFKLNCHLTTGRSGLFEIKQVGFGGCGRERA